MTAYSARASLVATRTRHTDESRWSLAALVAGLAALSAPYDLPLLRDAAFGMLLCVWVATRAYRFRQDCAARSGVELRKFSRRCSRVVYLTLYTALFVQLLCHMLRIDWSGGGFALALSLPFQAAPRHVVMQCGEAFRGHLLCGVIALLLIRVLAYQLRRYHP